MVTTRGGGTPVKRMESQYEDFLRDHFGTRRERRQHLKPKPKPKPKAAPQPEAVAKPKAKPKPKPASKRSPVAVRAPPAPKRTVSKSVARAPPKRTVSKVVAKPLTSPFGGGFGGGAAPLQRLNSTESNRMANALKDLVAGVSKLEVLLVVDGSGSMSCSGGGFGGGGKNRFEMVRECCALVPEAFAGRNVRTGIVQFGDNSRVELALSNDVDQVAKVAKEMVFMRSGTESGLPTAFEESNKMLKGERGAKKLMMFFTDGGSVGPQVIDKSKEIQDGNTTVVVVGVGTPMDLLNKVATGDHAYQLGNFAQLLEVMKNSY